MTKSVSRADLINETAQALDQPRVLVERIVTEFLTGLGAAVARGGRVALHDFGSFTRSVRKAGAGRNPRTGETIQIPARATARFKPGGGLKEALGRSA